ncbi:hypothetical protein U3516DRAFT_905897 [Neocallimastix sp. 'constans']|jgi:hypothetical protein
MVSLVKKIKNMYKGSYYYANKKYGKYTKRRPFPNFNDFDCSPSGDFSMKEIPAEMEVKKSDMEKTIFEKQNGYITTINENKSNATIEGSNANRSSSSTINVTSNVLTPINSNIFENGLNSISPISSISDNTDYTMVNSTDNRNSLSNPFNNAYEIKQSQSSSSFGNSLDNNKDSYVKQMNRISTINNNNIDSTSEDDIKIDYNGKNNWKVEIKRYYPSMPQVDEPDYYSNDNTNNSYNYNDRRQSDMPEYGMGMDMKKKNKWWKKMLPNNKRRNSNFSDNTFYDSNSNNYNDDYKYDSKHSTLYEGDYGSNSTYNSNRYNYNSKYDNDLTDGVLVVNQNVKTNSILY